MWFYRFTTFAELLGSGKITREELDAAIERGDIKPVRNHTEQIDHISGKELHQVFGITDYGTNG